jgi:anti-sigma regulatory factor (Ser/Thr protein kinase)
MNDAERTVVLPPELASVRTGRIFARDTVLAWDLARLTDDIQLGVSELVTNAVRHAGTDIELTVRLGAGVTVEVRDSDPELQHPAPAAAANPYAVSGRGLHIVAAISSDWGVRSRPEGKTVWFALDLPATDDADADVLDFDRHHQPAETPAEPGDGMSARAAH